MPSFVFDVFQLQGALRQLDLGLRLDGRWHFDTELSLGAWVEPFDESWTSPSPEGSKTVTIESGRKPGVAEANTVSLWGSAQAIVARAPHRPPGEAIAFDVRSMERFFGMPETTEYGPDLEEALLNYATEGSSVLILDSDSGSEETKMGAASILIWGLSGNTAWIAELKSDIAATPPAEPTLPPQAVSPPIATGAFPLTPKVYLATPDSVVPSPTDQNVFNRGQTITATQLPSIASQTRKTTTTITPELSSEEEPTAGAAEPTPVAPSATPYVVAVVAGVALLAGGIYLATRS